LDFHCGSETEATKVENFKIRKHVIEDVKTGTMFLKQPERSCLFIATYYIPS